MRFFSSRLYLINFFGSGNRFGLENEKLLSLRELSRSNLMSRNLWFYWALVSDDFFFTEFSKVSSNSLSSLLSTESAFSSKILIFSQRSNITS